MVVAVIAVGVGLLFLLALLVVLPMVVHRSIAPKLRERVASAYPGGDVVFEDLKANNFGLQSRGVTQLRGNGALVLTKSSLRFFQVLPRSEVNIPLSTITAVDTTRVHLGKTVGHKLLRVTFDLQGQSDTIAWYVTDVDAWIAKLASLGVPK
jgi:hypothetical protein